MSKMEGFDDTYDGSTYGDQVYNRLARAMDDLHEAGLIGTPDMKGEAGKILMRERTDALLNLLDQIEQAYDLTITELRKTGVFDA